MIFWTLLGSPVLSCCSSELSRVLFWALMGSPGAFLCSPGLSRGSSWLSRCSYGLSCDIPVLFWAFLGSHGALGSPGALLGPHHLWPCPAPPVRTPLNPTGDGEGGVIANKSTTNRFAQGTVPPERDLEPLRRLKCIGTKWNSESVCVADICIYIYTHRYIHTYIHIFYICI